MSARSLVFVSDVHITSGDSRRARLFLDFLGTLPRRARRLYVLGDLFDLWVGPAHHHYDGTPGVLSALEELPHSGVGVSFINGNRDFYLEHSLPPGTSIETLGDAHTIEVDGRRVYLGHGDLLCTHDLGHLRMRGFLQSRVFRTVFFALPAGLAYDLGNRLERLTERTVTHKPPQVIDIDVRAVRQVFEAGADVLICGHTHRPVEKTVEVGGRPCRLFVLDAWTVRPGFLEYRDGKFRRHNLDQDL